MTKEQVKESKQLQEKIIGEWKLFAMTDAYKDWMQSMGEYMLLIQDNVDNMTESRPTAIPGVTSKASIDPVQAAMMNQRKVGVRFCTDYAKLRVES